MAMEPRGGYVGGRLFLRFGRGRRRGRRAGRRRNG
uniref:Uncharacterized protein n=1 Tax=Arundo donax TaxID=35708 RepID=A0A0A8YDF8_ARUDO